MTMFIIAHFINFVHIFFVKMHFFMKRSTISQKINGFFPYRSLQNGTAENIFQKSVYEWFVLWYNRRERQTGERAMKLWGFTPQTRHEQGVPPAQCQQL